MRGWRLFKHWGTLQEALGRTCMLCPAIRPGPLWSRRNLSKAPSREQACGHDRFPRDGGKATRWSKHSYWTPNPTLTLVGSTNACVWLPCGAPPHLVVDGPVEDGGEEDGQHADDQLHLLHLALSEPGQAACGKTLDIGGRYRLCKALQVASWLLKRGATEGTAQCEHLGQQTSDEISERAVRFDECGLLASIPQQAARCIWD